MTTETLKASVPVIIVSVEALQEIPGESKMGLYDLETGDVCESKIAQRLASPDAKSGAAFAALQPHRFWHPVMLNVGRQNSR